MGIIIPVFALKDPKDYKKLIDLDAAANLGLEIPAEIINSADYIFENGTLKEQNKKQK